MSQDEDKSVTSPEEVLPETEDTTSVEPEIENSEEASSIQDILTQIEELQNEVTKKKDEALRTRAELENYRKRTLRDKEELRKTAAADLIEELLPIVDNMKLGLESAAQSPEAKVIAEGFQMVFIQLNQILQQQGLEAIEPVGEAFDPAQHDCVSQQPSEEVEADHIIQVVRTGYRLHDRLVRPASVVTSSGSESNTPEEATEETAS